MYPKEILTQVTKYVHRAVNYIFIHKNPNYPPIYGCLKYIHTME